MQEVPVQTMTEYVEMLFIKLTDCMSFKNFSFGSYSFIVETFS